jgi:hypothetical protein
MTTREKLAAVKDVPLHTEHAILLMSNPHVGWGFILPADLQPCSPADISYAQYRMEKSIRFRKQRAAATRPAEIAGALPTQEGGSVQILEWKEGVSCAK